MLAAMDDLENEKAELIEATRVRAARLGYTVTATPEGFTVERDLADARYWGPLHLASVKTLTGHEVQVDPATRTVKITDVHRNIEWRAGNDGLDEWRPFWSADTEVTRGRIVATGTTRSWGVREDGTVGTIEDYSFDTNAGRSSIRSSLAELGWREAMPLDQRIGLFVAIGTAVLLVLCFGGWGLIALLG
jgi:hypothetical protein